MIERRGKMKKLPDYKGWDLLKKQTVEEPAHTLEGHTDNIIGLLDRVVPKNVVPIRQGSESPVAFYGNQAGEITPNGMLILIGLSQSKS